MLPSKRQLPLVSSAMVAMMIKALMAKVSCQPIPTSSTHIH